MSWFGRQLHRFFPRGAQSALILFCALPGLGQTQANSTPAQTPPPRPAFTPTPEMLAIQAASEKDHQRVMDELGIKELRPGADADPKSPHAANYDESKANPYPSLPDPLVLNNGRRVTTPDMWWQERRPEIVEMFDREILGRTPLNTPKVNWEVKSVVHERNGDVPVVTKTLVGHVDNSGDPSITVNIDLTLSTPENANRPVPVIMEYGLSKEFLALLAKRFPQFAEQNQKGPAGSVQTWQQQVLAKGWGYAEYIPTSLQEDNGAGLTKGIIGLVNKGQPRKLDDWGTLKAWGWGASRCLDYFQTDKDVDAKQVGLEGHSRYGKSVLVTMAYDPRFAIAYVSSSGEGGAKLYRHVFGEQVGNVAATNEYHWMAGNFLHYAGPKNPGDMPIDNHELIALCAPRPVFISVGSLDSEERWIDPRGMFKAAVAAGPVYRLLGKKDLGTTEFPLMETPLLGGDLSWRQHSGGHTPGPNWPTFLTFAGRYLHARGAVASADPPPVHLSAAQDRERLLALVGLKDSDMRPPPASDPKAADATNYDEARANVYTNLPDPLVLKNGQRVTTPETWFDQRRPEIVADFEREIWGHAPANLPAVEWKPVNIRPERCGNVDVILKRLSGRVDNSSYPPIAVDIDLILVTPEKAPGPVPVIMELAFDKEFQRIAAGHISETVSGGAPGYGVNWQAVLDKGWGLAVLSPTSFQADDGSGLTEGIIGLMNKGQPRAADDWGALRAWAWGASRALDYLETDRAVDARQVGLEGHSRFGKTVLVAMAYDPRFAIAYSSSSGEGGAKLYRHIFGETMSNLANTPLYHWFSGNFLRYGGPRTPADLPVDNHELIALAAPRPLFIGGGGSVGDGYAEPNGDAWADPRGMFLAEVAAGPVYRLLGKEDLGTTEFPAMETALVNGDLAFRQHPNGHTPVPNWPAFLDFASRYLHAPQHPQVLAKAFEH
jgi:hypothetical protein